MSKNRRNNQNQPIEGEFTPVEEEAEESEQAVLETAPETPEEKDTQKSIRIGRLTLSFESREAKKAMKAARKQQKADKPKKGVSIPVLVAGTIVVGTAIKEGARLAMKAMDRTYVPSLPESGEDSDSYSSDSVDDGIALVEESDTQE